MSLELTTTKDKLAEKDMYIRNVDKLYGEIIESKDKTIECFNRVTSADDEMAKGFKRLLMKTLADKEVQNVKELYMEMKCRNVSTQAEAVTREKKGNCVDVSTQVSCYDDEIATNDSERMPDLEEVRDSLVDVSSTEQAVKSTTLPSMVPTNNSCQLNKCSTNKDNELVTLRVMNLPNDMDIPSVENLFDIKASGPEKVCEVVIDRINDQRIVVKIVTPENLAQSMLKLDQTLLHRRKIKVFRVEKCRLGADCARKVCRFGHEERFGTGKQPAAWMNNTPNNTGAGDSLDENSRDNSKDLHQKEPSLWKIKNLPEKMNTVGLIRFITNLGVVVEERRSMYQVLSIKKHENSKGSKVEAVLAMTEEMGKRLMSHNGMEVENCHVEIIRTKKCRHGDKCQNMGKNCPFYHEHDIASARNRSVDSAEVQSGPAVPLCWFQSSCPFGKKCRFSHPNSTPALENLSVKN